MKSSEWPPQRLRKAKEKLVEYAKVKFFKQCPGHFETERYTLYRNTNRETYKIAICWVGDEEEVRYRVWVGDSLRFPKELKDMVERVNYLIITYIRFNNPVPHEEL